MHALSLQWILYGGSDLKDEKSRVHAQANIKHITSDRVWFLHLVLGCVCLFRNPSLKVNNSVLRLSDLIPLTLPGINIWGHNPNSVTCWPFPKWSIPRISEPISLPSPPLCSNLSNYIWHVTSIISFIFLRRSFSHPTNQPCTLTYTNIQKGLLTPMLLSVSAGNVSHAAFNKNNFLHHWSHSTCFSVLFFSSSWSSVTKVFLEVLVLNDEVNVKRWLRCMKSSGGGGWGAIHTEINWISRGETHHGHRHWWSWVTHSVHVCCKYERMRESVHICLCLCFHVDTVGIVFTEKRSHASSVGATFRSLHGSATDQYS